MTGARIFISYARSTQPVARRIVEALQHQGYRVWMDDQLLAHRSFADAIEEQVRLADAVLVLWSTDAVRSEWVRSEANRGREAGKLVQVQLDACALPMPFDQIHAIDLSGWSGALEQAPWPSVLASIAAAAGHRHRAAAAPTDPLPGARSHGQGAARATPAERRQVTSLFAGIAGFADLSAATDPEDLLLIIDAFQGMVEDLVPQYGGTIARRLDHGVLAHFGYPVAHEEEGANAVRAGLAVRDAAAALELPEGLSVAAGVGLATGMVLVGDLSSRGAAAERGILGETPKLAAALAEAARPGAVVMADSTLRITEGMFVTGGPEEVAGQRAVEALEARKVASRSQARAGRDEALLVGRAVEMQLLKDAWALAERGEGQVVLVQGEAGIGKSGLADAARRHAEGDCGVPVSWYCGPNFSARALHPVTEHLEAAAGFVRGDTAAHKSEKLAALLDRAGARTPETEAVLGDLLGLPPAANAPVLTPERRRALGLDTLLGLMDRLAADRPALFVIEDLHWGDPSSLELLDRAVGLTIVRRWMILATARPDFACGWAEHADIAHVALRRLEAGEAREICARLDPERLLAVGVVREIVARADGNPLFLAEITRSVLEAIAAAPDGETPALLAIPDTLQDSLIARLDRLGPARQIASIGAAIGRGFPYDLLAEVVAEPAAELRQALRELTRAGILDATGLPPNSSYLFRHALIRDAAYDSMPKRAREALHGRIAAALRSLTPDIAETDPAGLADHLTRGGSGAEAIPLWAAAGRQAAGRAAHAEAAGQLRTALDLLRRHRAPDMMVDVELQLLLGLAVSLAATRGYSHEEVGRVLGEARTICDAIGNVAGLFVVLRGICAFSIVGGDLDVAEDLARRCLEIGERSGDIGQRIEGECPLGYVLWAKGRMAEARVHLERAVELYVANEGGRLPLLTPQDPLVQSLGPLQVLLHAMGDAPAASKAATQLVSHVATLGESFSAAAGHYWTAFGALWTGRFEDAARHAGIAAAMCEQQGYTSLASFAVIRTYALDRLGPHAVALAEATRGLEMIERLGQEHTRAFHLGELARLQGAAGDAATALATVTAAIETAARCGEHFWLSPLHRQRAGHLWAIGDEAGARAAIADAIEVARAQGAGRFGADAQA